MKITYGWLREFAPLDVAPDELAAQLTLAGLEVESVVPAAPPFSGVVVGEVLECGRHPDAEKLSLCQVTTGTERLQIICGAPNVRRGLKVAVAMAGAKLPGNVAIERTTLRGLESNGMLCSARELGLGEEHAGILELDPALAPGRDLRAALDLDDTLLEVNATPNRGDCMSVFGIARDHAAAHGRRYLTYQATAVPARHDAVFPVAIAAPAACPVFACRVIRGVGAQGRSPAWLRERLRRVGLNSISPIVDVTNHVMIELGQPLHAYDLGRLSGGIEVRMPTAGERLTLLDDKEYALEPDNLIIADAGGPIGLAGIMGGRATAISESTTEVLLEAAHFTPEAVAGRARRFGLFTDAAQRFERGVDPTLPVVALERATALLLEIAGGEPGPVQLTRGEPPRGETGRRGQPGAMRRNAEPQATVAHGGASTEETERAWQRDAAALEAERQGWQGVAKPDAQTRGAGARPESSARASNDDGWVELRRTRLRRLLGVEVPDDEVASLLGAITDRLEITADGWRVRPPPHRFDVRIEADLIEEVARLRGFDSIEEIPALAPQVAGYATEARVGNERLLTAMADRGYREVITYTFVEPALQRQLFPQVPALALANAISADLSEMRVSLWSGLVRAARDNHRRQQPRVRLFEIGKKFVLDPADSSLREVETLAGIVTGTRWPEQWGGRRESADFYDVKADLGALLAMTGDEHALRFEAAPLDCLRPGRAARILRGSVPVGWLGELHPRLIKTLDLSPNVLLFELELELTFVSRLLKFNKISKFPSVRRDLAVVVDESVPLAVLQENVTVSASGLLSELRIFDVYRGPGVETGRKSIALGLILQDSSRTLTDVDADAVVTRVVLRLRDVLSASIRDQ